MKAIKKQFRSKMKLELEKVTMESIKRQSEFVFNKVASLPEFNAAEKVSIFLSMPTEINTRPIVELILNQGKMCFVPICTKLEMKMVLVKSVEDYHNLPLNSWQIPEPKLEDCRPDCFEKGGLDLIIMPGLAFDESGHRIGYGKGYYDKFLAKSYQFAIDNHLKRPFSVAICLKEQMVKEVPTESTDLKPDVIIYE